MYNDLCVYLGTGRILIIVSVYCHDNRSSQYGAKYDYKLIHNTIVLHESVEKQ